MPVIGRVESVWRYPVKSMRGEQPAEIFLGYAGIYGDRMYAFATADGLPFFPYLTARKRPEMLLFAPRFREPEGAARPPHLLASQQASVGLTPLYGEGAAMAVEVVTPGGEVLAVDDPALAALLGDPAALRLLRSERALTDCRPVTLFSLQTVAALAAETGLAVDKRRFRANLYADFPGMEGFAEEGLLGRRLQIGERVVIALVERDPRCRMIALDPDTACEEPALLERVVRAHGNFAGVYGAVLVEGLVRAGDPIALLD